MQNDDFAFEEANPMQNETDEGAGRHQERWIMFAGGLSLLFALVAGVLFLRARRRPTRLQRAEVALATAAMRAEQAARTVRKQGPSLLARGAQRTENMARTVRKQGPAVVVRGGTRVEQLGRAIRKQGPGILARGAARVEQAARSVRKQGPSMVAHSAERAEQAARSVRKQGPPLLRQGVQRTEKVVERARAASQEFASQAGRAVEYTRAAGSSVAEGTQDLLERAQKRVGR